MVAEMLTVMEARAFEQLRRRLVLSELLARPDVSAVVLDERTMWLLAMWAEGVLSREDLAGAIEHHGAPLLAGLPGGADALELLRTFDR
jgi:hypothetical protein